MHIPDDHWQPLSVEETVSLFAPASFQWGIAGGYAIELFAGHVYRAHGDTDVIIFRDEQLQAQQHLNDWALFAADPPGTLRPWHADEFLARGIHDIWGHQHGVDAWQFQFMVMEIDGDAWFSAYDIVRHPKVLDAVEAIIGPDILVWGGTFFFKPPRSGGFVSWHQDMTYWGIENSDRLVSAWLALDTVDKANGCMRFFPGSHRQGILNHEDTWSEENILTRGQSVAMDDDAPEIVDVELAAGEISLHHGHLLHASSPNHSDRWRLGFAINYVSPDNRQVVAPRDFAMLVRGEDRHGHFEPIAPPVEELDEASLRWHRRILNAQNDALYEGAAGAG